MIGLFRQGCLIRLLKQAKTRQITLTTALLQQTRYPTRNLAIFLLSIKAGLRAKEIASLTWDMVTDAEGNLGPALHLRDEASKGSSGRVIPLNKDLRDALQKLHDTRDNSPLRHHHRTSRTYISRCNRQPLRSMVQLDWSQGWSSHSGRRTFITNAARTISTVGGSLRDVQMLAGHRALSTTQRYIEADVEAQKRVVDLV